MSQPDSGDHRPPVPRAGLITALLLFLSMLLVPGAALAQPGEGDHDQWYIIEMDGQRAGSMQSTQRTHAEQIITRSALRLEIRRGDMVIPVTMETEFVETLDHKPVFMKSVQAMGAAPTTMAYTFGAEEVTLVTSQEGREPVTTVLPLPEGQWLTPAAARAFTHKRLEADAREIVVRTVDPLMRLQPVVSTRKVLERTTVEAMGKMIPAIRTSVMVSTAPGVETIEFVDERGIPVRMTTNLGVFALTMVATEREAAEAAADPPELMMRTLVKADRVIRSPRAVRRGVYVLRAPDGDGSREALQAIPQSGVQRVEQLAANAVRVTVDMDDPLPAAASDVSDPAYTGSSLMVNTLDERIIALARRATADARSKDDAAAARAEAMRRFVYRYITSKNLGVGFASASEVAQSREGDCTEHAALLTAMLRADGIPARAVSGLVYADSFAGSQDIFGYHMWTQALLDIDGTPMWVDLDATLPPRTPFDATHIALSITSLADDEPQEALLSLAPLLGRLAIEVQDVDRRPRPRNEAGVGGGAEAAEEGR